MMTKAAMNVTAERQPNNSPRRYARLNYQHLFYFWSVVRAGSLTRACEELNLSAPTVSTQLKVLEQRLGEKLLIKTGRTLTPTEAGRIVFRYADEIFGLGREMQDTLQGRPGVPCDS
jgi:LysR family transcriptional activator of nhaA